ncbi:MAG: BREX-2 system phosphatase PglZ [Leptothrix sp. (in: b-proteobacteria)]
MTVSTPQITAQLDAVLAREPGARAIAIRATKDQTWPDHLPHRGRSFSVRWCASMLAIRSALTELDESANDVSGLVLMTPLSEHEVSQDILTRLARSRIFQPEGWAVIRELFRAKEIDARLGRQPWMPQLLIDGTAQGDYEPVPSGFLDLDTAWREVLSRSLGLGPTRPDAVALLAWTLSPASSIALDALPEAARVAVMAWLRDTCGPIARLIQGCVEGKRLTDAVPIALVCEVVFASTDTPDAALGHAAIRLERYVNDLHVNRLDGKAWAEEVRQLLLGASITRHRPSLDRADDLLRELHLGEFAHLSDHLPSGLNHRMRLVAQALTSHVQVPSEAGLVMVEDHVDRALRHRLLVLQPQRQERVLMARRLARWLLRPDAPGQTLKDAASWQVGEGAHVDWARFRLLGGDELPELSAAYALLRDQVIARRDVFARRFAQALNVWNSTGNHHGGQLLPVESVLSEVVAPLAAHHPVMLLVMDGLSTSIYRELFAGIAHHGWMELQPGDELGARIGVAALPTVTEVSRASLLCGRLVTGSSSVEKPGFASHSDLLKASHAGHPPRLFHKAELAELGNLSSELRAAIADRQRQVVGVVYNAVDDHLSGPDQLHQRWSLEDLRLLLPVLHEARQAGRLVVITADHGHLLEDGSTKVDAAAQSDRWAPGDQPRSEAEMVFRRGRVKTVEGDESVVCLWGERTRYGSRKNGYHGGVSPQEVIVPLHVLAPMGVSIPNWSIAPPTQPDWWELPHYAPDAKSPAITVSGTPKRTPSKRVPPVETPQAALFEPIETPAMVTAAPPDWIAAVLSSPTYAGQRQLAARVAPKDEQMRLLLLALHERGGKLTKAALAQRLGLAEVRLGGLLSAVRRLLNVDQALVVSVDEAAGTVTFNHALLLQQFGVSAPGSKS